MKYTVYVDDNSHYMDESERHTLGKYRTYRRAVRACKRKVDRYLASAYKIGISEEELVRSFTSFGPDPFIVPSDGKPEFSSWKYAKERCRVICGKGVLVGMLRKLFRWLIW